MSSVRLSEEDPRYSSSPGSEERPFRISEVNASVRASLEAEWSGIWIEGELSNLTRSAAGHVYFTLNDEDDGAQLSGVIFRSDAARAGANLESGARVQMRGRLSLYEPRGRFQFIARIARPAGQGELQARFRKIHDKLKAEGLFEEERKRPLPRMPVVVGIVTSRTGAAVHDIIRVTRERCPTRLVIADCRVQGESAAASIVAALEAIQKLPGLEVVILSRGGGSAEDLWAFNEEVVARAIAACSVPVVSGVGHEVDFTIADFVADARAATPSNAAEIVIPDRVALRAMLLGHRHELERSLETRIGRYRLRLERLQQKLEDPRYGLSGIRRRLSQLDMRLRGWAAKRIRAERAHLHQLTESLRRHDSRVTLARDRRRLESITARMRMAIRPALSRPSIKIARLASRLDALSPLSVLGRGYAIAIHDESGRALRKSDEATVGDRITLRLSEGTLKTRVEGEG